ncbi:hypothetical protein [Gordonia effusa]|nr:hypothetical protein [Gordonia effusa]
MTTDDSVRRTAEAFSRARELNERAVPMGYAVLTTAGEEQSQSGRVFESHYAVRPFGTEDGRADRYFPDIEAAAEYIDYLETLPRWTLDLTDSSIEVDGVRRTIAVKETGQVHDLSGGWLSLGGKSRSGVIGDGLTSLSIRASQPPAFGRWRKDA